MSSNRYFEFDSSFRDRNMYPNPCDFTMEMSQSGQKNKENARDPVSFASPILSWNQSFLEDAKTNNTGGATVPGTISVEYGTTPSDQLYLQVALSSGILRRLKNFYTGAILQITVGGIVNYKRIVFYEFLSDNGTSSKAIIKLDVALPPGPATAGVIYNPSSSTTASTTVPNKIFIPSGINVDNYYTNYYIQSVGSDYLGQSAKIRSYDGTTHLATLETSTTNNWNSSSININFVMRKELPFYTSSFIANTTSVTTGALANEKLIQLTSSASNVLNSYNLFFARLLNPYPSASATTPNFTYPSSSFGDEIQVLRYFAAEGKSLVHSSGVGQKAFTLDSSASTVDNYYTGYLITDEHGEVRQIISYVGSTRSGTVSKDWTTAATGLWYMRTIELKSAFSSAITTGNIEIEQFSKDNYSPFIFTGSVVSSQEMVCYEIELLNLILPNIVLISNRGGRPIFYPYLYVTLQQVGGTSGNAKNIIYSNNPSSTKMTFRAVVDDTPLPSISPFIKIDGDGMVHIIKFKPNESFKLGIYHSNGDIFQVDEQDNYSPTEVNPLVQISACFSFKRISND